VELQEWRKQASCRELEKRDFYAHEQGERSPIPEFVINACASCPVKAPCLQYALTYEDYGYWGGTTARERREMRLKAKVHIRRLDVRLPAHGDSDGE